MNAGKMRRLSIILVVCLMLLACGKQSTPQAPSNAETDTACPTMESTDQQSTDAPLAAAQRLQNALLTVRPTDDGDTGIGTVRGNSNSNYANEARAVKAPDGSIYYATTTETGDMRSVDTLCLLDTDGATRILYCVDNNLISSLNLYGDYLYFLAPNDGAYHFGIDAGIYRLNRTSDIVENILPAERADRLILAYGLIVVSNTDPVSVFTTTIYDANTLTCLCTIADFRAYGVLDGWLYGDTAEDGGSSLRIDLLTGAEESLPFAGIPINGKLFSFEEAGVLHIFSLDKGTAEQIGIAGDYRWAYNLAVGSDAIYIKTYEEDSWGYVYRCTFDGQILQKETESEIQDGFSLLEGELAVHFVPCD